MKSKTESVQNSPPLLDLTQDLKELVRLAGTEDTVDDLLRRGLDWLARLAPYDLATVFTLRGNELIVRAARGTLARSALKGHRISLEDFPSIREALETRRVKVNTAHDHGEGDGDPFDGVLDLAHGHSCMVVPLVSGDRAYGVMTLDRTRCEQYPESVAGLVEVYGQVLALAIDHAERRSILTRLHGQADHHARVLEAELTGDVEADASGMESSGNPRVREIVWRARQVAQTDTPVLILGETGTGKERLARAVHVWSRRTDRPFVKVNCAVIPAGLLESELFGHVKGAFTGAVRDRVGRFQLANGGTLMLDEVGELPFDLQAKLLRVLQEGTLEPLGSDRTIRVDVRVLAATHVNLEEAIVARRFREDLFYRLSVFPLQLPPLRERKEDLAYLVGVILREQSHRTGGPLRTASLAVIEKLRGYHWPGNIRELANVLERASILSSAVELDITRIDVPEPTKFTPRDVQNVELQTDSIASLPTLEHVEREHIRAVLRVTRGRLYGPNGAAKVLGLKPSTLQSRMKKLGITRLGDILK